MRQILIIAAMLLAACGKNQPSMQLSSDIDTSADNLYVRLSQVASLPGYSDFVAAKAGSSFARLTPAFNNVHIGGELVLGGTTLTMTNAVRADAIAGTDSLKALYGSVGGYWQAIGFDAKSAISRQDLKAGLAVAAKYQNIISQQTSGPKATFNDDERVAILKLSLALSALDLAGKKPTSQLTDEEALPSVQLALSSVPVYNDCTARELKVQHTCAKPRSTAGAGGYHENCPIIDVDCQIISASYGAKIAAVNRDTANTAATGANADQQTATINNLNVTPPDASLCKKDGATLIPDGSTHQWTCLAGLNGLAWSFTPPRVYGLNE